MARPLGHPVGLSEEPWLSAAERADFQRVFTRVAERLPSLFRPFWARWEESSAIPACIMVYAEDGSAVFQLSRLPSGFYRAAGITKQGTIIYAAAERSIADAVRAAGLI